MKTEFIEKNIILADCEPDEIIDFKDGMGVATGKDFKIISSLCNKPGKSKKLFDLKRYFKYFSVPFGVFIKRKKYDVIIGWQQFYALIYSWFCSIFHVKKSNFVCAVNYTYKEKEGFIGKIYFKLMKKCVEGKYLDCIHVPSENYKQRLLEIFDIPEKKIIVTGFGTPDRYEEFKNSSVSEENYILSIGRSNRDYDWIISEWTNISKYSLLIISDVYKNDNLPANVKIIKSYDQYPYIMNSKFVIVPLKDCNLCSGDTVLLNSMAFKKLVIVSYPSTLAEMYIQDGINGKAISKDSGCLSDYINSLTDEDIARIGEQARKSFLNNFSRYAMGKNLGEKININELIRR